MDAGGEYIRPGVQVDGLWVTGFELRAALRHGILQGATWAGYIWERGKATGDRHPFREYFSKVFAEKESHRDKNPALYLYYKYLANSLTGKFVATIPQLEVGDNGLEKYRVPGALFNAPVGALITGAGREFLFEAEIVAKSVHGATDSLVVPPWGNTPPGIGPNMGQLEKVVSGQFVCGRNKLYAFLGPKSGDFTGERKDETGKTTKFYEGQEILKYATHAFQGTVFEFLGMILGGRKTYQYTRMVQMREASRRPSLKPLQMTEFTGEIKLGGKYGEKVNAETA